MAGVNLMFVAQYFQGLAESFKLESYRYSMPSQLFRVQHDVLQ